MHLLSESLIARAAAFRWCRDVPPLSIFPRIATRDGGFSLRAFFKACVPLGSLRSEAFLRVLIPKPLLVPMVPVQSGSWYAAGV